MKTTYEVWKSDVTASMFEAQCVDPEKYWKNRAMLKARDDAGWLDPWYDLIAIVQFDTQEEASTWWKQIHDNDEIRDMKPIFRLLRR